MSLEKLKFNFFNRQFRKTKPKNIYKYKDNYFISKLFNERHKKKFLILQTQIGRGGAKWLIDILNTIESITAFGERNAKEESFYRYCRSHNIYKFDEKFLNLIKSEIISDWETSYISLISSPYFSHGIDFLDKELSPKKIIILLPSAKRLISSLKNKGWYINDLEIDIGKFQDLPKSFIKKENHFYGRMINFENFNSEFYRLTQVGKISLFISTTLQKIYNQVKNLDKKKILIFRLDEADQNYDYCKNFIKKLDLNLKISEKEFLKLKKRTSGSHENKEIIFNDLENDECRNYLKIFNYYENKFLNEFDSRHS
jgi:hypothetical protein